jgi:hypothetical protein
MVVLSRNVRINPNPSTGGDGVGEKRHQEFGNRANNVDSEFGCQRLSCVGQLDIAKLLFDVDLSLVPT